MSEINDSNTGANAGAILSKRRTTARSTVNDSVLMHGKLPPQAIDLEEAVLGALMLEKDALTAVIDLLKPASFYKEAHQKIYEAISRLFQRSEPIDILTVTHELKKTGDLELVGGPYYITQLTNRIASAANIEFHARIILQKHIQRELIRISTDTIKNAFEDSSDVFELLDSAERNLFEIAEGNIRKNYESMRDLISKAVKEIEEKGKLESGISGVPSGFTALDRVTSGWQKSDLIIIAARPGMGKTAFVMSLARNAAVDFKKPVAMFSLEMASIQLVNRLISSESMLKADVLRRGKLAEHEWQQLNSKITKLTEAPIFIDDTPALSIFELRAKCRRLKAQHGISMIIIDYLQLMTANDGKNGGNREQEISTISRSLKALAKELEVPVIALSQLSRAVETRGGDKRPQLSDLRESGAIEQDADMVMFIYRPEYYNITEDEGGIPLNNQAQIIIAKHRNGSLEDVKLKFEAQYARFSDYESGDYVDSTFTSMGEPDAGGNFNSIIRSSRMNEMNDDAPF